MNETRTDEWMTVREMSKDVGVSDEKVRGWCRRGAIEGAMNIGDRSRTFFRVPRKNWEAFKATRRIGPAPLYRPKSRVGTNHLGL